MSAPQFHIVVSCECLQLDSDACERSHVKLIHSLFATCRLLNCWRGGQRGPKGALHRPQNELYPATLNGTCLQISACMLCFFVSCDVQFYPCVALDSITPGYAHDGPTVSDKESTREAGS